MELRTAEDVLMDAVRAHALAEQAYEHASQQEREARARTSEAWLEVERTQTDLRAAVEDVKKQVRP